MCELFGISSSRPVRVRYSLHVFAEHGGLLHPNKSGWGVAYHEGRDALLIKEPEPASDSPFVRFIGEQPLVSTCFMAHVRYATAGEPSFANTHPFIRELGGQMHLFAHNGSLEDVRERARLPSTRFQPVGETDSEHAFCVLLGRLAPKWTASGGPPPLAERIAVIAETARDLARLGPANFLYSDGETLFAHAHRRSWDEGGGRFSAPRPPGLSYSRRQEIAVAGLRAVAPHEDTEAIYVASVPLTESGWTPLPESTLIAFDGGRVVAEVGTGG
ncbi:MAG: class II glutamine amidotransferase [Rhodovulum sp.]|nr:class II glutamine amidotransferase [Rhodovulum sp.]